MMLAVFLCALAAQSVLAADAARPNILFLMADQQRWDMMGAYGNTIVKTPNLDQLASEGVTFTHAYTSTPTCTPARAAILTGLSPWFHGMLGYGVIAPQYPFEFPRSMVAAGYSTASIGKDHFGWNKTTNEGIPHGYEKTQIYDGLGNGFQNGSEYDNYDMWFQSVMPGKNPLATGLGWNSWHGKPYVYPEYYHPTAWVGRQAVTYISNYTDPRPFFLKISAQAPTRAVGGRPTPLTD